MDDDDLPKRRTEGEDYGAASQLARESLDAYSLGELDARTALLEAEVARIAAHKAKASSHMQAAEALFRPKPS